MTAASSSLLEPLFELLASGRRKLGKEETGASMISSPDHVRVAVQFLMGSGEYEAERDAGAYRNRIGGLHGESMFADVESNTGDRSGIEFQIDHASHHVVA